MSKLLVIQAAALTHNPRIEGLTFRRAQSVMPAVTCTVQGSFRTASPPAAHGMVANGLYFRRLRKVMFWEQSSALVAGRRIWTDFRRKGGSVGMLFWQQSMGEDVDLVLSPAPIHKHHGGLIQDCYCRPPGLYAKLCRLVGRRFKLRHYWGPSACAKAGEWIADATAALLDLDSAPDLCLTYLPTLDYDFQRFGPDHDKCRKAKDALNGQLRRLVASAARHGYEVVVFGDYAVGPVAEAVYLNRVLCGAGLMATRRVKGMLYSDFHSSRAFAVVDHEVAHVYVSDPADVASVAELLSATAGVGEVLDGRAKRAAGLNHTNSGELVVVAEAGKWFAYPWWRDKRRRPDYATHVDIHSKPGFDPCELLFGWPPMSTGQRPDRIGGSHGRVRPDREVTWAATFDPENEPGNLIDLAAAVRDRLERE